MRKILVGLAFMAVPCVGFVQSADPQSQPSAGKPSPASPELAEASKLSAKAVQLYNQNSYDDALPLAKQVLELREKALGPDHQLIATSLNNVAAIYMEKHHNHKAWLAARQSHRTITLNFYR